MDRNIADDSTKAIGKMYRKVVAAIPEDNRLYNLIENVLEDKKEWYEDDDEENTERPPEIRKNHAITTTFSKRLTLLSGKTSHFLPRLKRLRLGVVHQGLDSETLTEAIASGILMASGQSVD